MFKSALLTVVLPTYDREEVTHRAVNSVKTARPDQVEILVVDDCGSKEYSFNTAKNLHGVAVSVIRTPENGGPSLARKFGVENSRSAFIAFLDSDDTYEEGWIDSVLSELEDTDNQNGSALFITGKVRRGSFVTDRCFSMLAACPRTLGLGLCRVVLTFFNPFYTPSTIMSRELCDFHESLRHCEDYYTNARALFKAREVKFVNCFSCTLSRRPGSLGGESGSRSKMYFGEMTVRRSLLASPEVPFGFKALIPLGMAYQLCRTWIKKMCSQ